MAAEPADRDKPAFRDVDRDDGTELIAMMDATDRWDAVIDGRAWILDHTSLGAGDLVLDVGCGPGTFGRLARARGARTVDVDRSLVMAAETRRRDPAAAAAAVVVVRAELPALPVRTNAADIVHIERVLQWVDEPAIALAELIRAVRPSGWLAVTDTRWDSLAIGLGTDVDRVVRAAAEAWVPHARFVSSLAARLGEAGWRNVSVSRHEVVITGWDPDDPAQREGPPGLPLRTMADALEGEGRGAARQIIDRLARQARRGRIDVRLPLVTVVATKP